MSCMECLYAHIPSHSLTPSHMPMPSVTTVTSSANDTRISNPYRLTSTHCKYQWTTNPDSIPTPITQLEVYVLIVCLILGNKNFRITSRVSYTHTEFFGSHRGSLTPNVPGFSPEGLTTPFLLRPTHINYISFHSLNRESFIGRRPKYKLTTHSLTLIIDDHTHAPTPNMLMSLCICNANVTAISHVPCMMHTT